MLSENFLRERYCAARAVKGVGPGQADIEWDEFLAVRDAGLLEGAVRDIVGLSHGGDVVPVRVVSDKLHSAAWHLRDAVS